MVEITQVKKLVIDGKTIESVVQTCGCCNGKATSKMLLDRWDYIIKRGYVLCLDCLVKLQEACAGEIDRLREQVTDASMEPLFYILSLKHTRPREYALTWWRLDDKGFTDDLDTAVKHTLAEISHLDNHYNNGAGTLAVPCELARRHMKVTRPVDAQSYVPNTKTLRATFKKAAKAITVTDEK